MLFQIKIIDLIIEIIAAVKESLLFWKNIFFLVKVFW